MPEETPMSAQEIVEKSTRYTLYDWQAQGKLAPIAVDRAEGVHFWDVDGKRYLDFNSQLMGVNIGHGDKRVSEAISRQAEKLPYISPFMAYETRARLGEKLASLWPGELEKTFFTLGGAEANENAIRIAKAYTGRQKILARYRSYHGATYATINLTGDPRRWANENPPMPGIVHVLDPYRGTVRGTEDADAALASLEETIELEGSQTIAAFILETVTGTNGILIPPDGYLEGVRELCSRHGIVMIADEVMCGFGRTGEWFAVNHWDVVPDLMTAAKGLTSSYLPLGAVAIRPDIAAHFEDHVFFGGLTYNSHPLSCAAAIAAIQVLEEDDLVGNAKRLDPVMRRQHEELMAKHPSVGRIRNIGLFGILELVESRETMEPLSPYNVVNETMQAVNEALLERGLFTMIRFNGIMTNPPLCIAEEQLEEGFAIVDEALEVADRAIA
ncbi:MAG TPA: aminotransferase class III-fold pyridoxal phosphate-dependent enzyme [Actinomycetota bacterium]|jgi:taurine--2-oxoglutarate transaminase|nr:aminotransferase class III-fold pyridoxal phosphate-dependent enzyme [Actinomycetota bacterium]